MDSGCCGGRSRTRAAGFTYIGILLAIALLGTTLAAAGQSWSMQQRRADEQQLIFVGQAFRRAIGSYYSVTPRGSHQYPTALGDLLFDDRGPRPMRHLRELYTDPITGRADWQLVSLPDGAIVGVASRATGTPLKVENFGPWEAEFEHADCYCDWRFVYLPDVVAGNGKP